MSVTVRQLILYLERFDPNLPVAYDCCSEQVELELKELRVEDLCMARPDGWVANKRPDKPTIPYLVFPGN